MTKLPATIEAWFFSKKISIVHQAPLKDDSGLALSTTDGIFAYKFATCELLKRVGSNKWEQVIKDGDSEQMDLFGG